MVLRSFRMNKTVDKCIDKDAQRDATHDKERLGVLEKTLSPLVGEEVVVVTFYRFDHFLFLYIS